MIRTVIAPDSSRDLECCAGCDRPVTYDKRYEQCGFCGSRGHTRTRQTCWRCGAVEHLDRNAVCDECLGEEPFDWDENFRWHVIEDFANEYLDDEDVRSLLDLEYRPLECCALYFAIHRKRLT